MSLKVRIVSECSDEGIKNALQKLRGIYFDIDRAVNEKEVERLCAYAEAVVSECEHDSRARALLIEIKSKANKRIEELKKRHQQEELAIQTGAC